MGLELVGGVCVCVVAQKRWDGKDRVRESLACRGRAWHAGWDEKGEVIGHGHRREGMGLYTGCTELFFLVQILFPQQVIQVKVAVGVRLHLVG